MNVKQVFQELFTYSNGQGVTKDELLFFILNDLPAECSVAYFKDYCNDLMLYIDSISRELLTESDILQHIDDVNRMKKQILMDAIDQHPRFTSEDKEYLQQFVSYLFQEPVVVKRAAYGEALIRLINAGFTAKEIRLIIDNQLSTKQIVALIPAVETFALEESHVTVLINKKLTPDRITSLIDLMAMDKYRSTPAKYFQDFIEYAVQHRLTDAQFSAYYYLFKISDLPAERTFSVLRKSPFTEQEACTILSIIADNLTDDGSTKSDTAFQTINRELNIFDCKNSKQYIQLPKL